MGIKELAVRKFNALMDKKQDTPERQRGILGDGSGIVRVDERPDLVYIRINADSTRIWKVINDKVSDTNNLPVIMEKLPGAAWWRVTEIDRSMLANVGSGWGGKQFPRTHGEEHEWPDYSPGPDATNIHRRNLFPLKTEPTTTYSLDVVVRPHRYTYQGVFMEFLGDTLPLTSYVPTTGIRAVLTYLDVRTGLVGAIPGGTVTYSILANPPAPISPWYGIPSGLVTLRETQNVITESDIDEPRPLFDKVDLVHVLQAERDPTTSDDALLGYSEGSIWINRTNEEVFVCTNPAIGAASWQFSAPVEYSDGGEARGKDRTLGNTDDYDLGFLTNNQTRIFIQNDGEVGIGTTSPEWNMELEGTTTTIFQTRSSGDGAVQWRMKTDSTNRRFIGLDNSDNPQTQMLFGDAGNFEVWGPTASNKIFRVDAGPAPTDSFHMDSSGFVGLGVAAPAERLEIEDDEATTTLQISNAAADGDPQLAFALSGTKTFTIGVDDTDDFFKIGTTAVGTNTRLTIDSSGNVGIGTASPDTKLQVVGDTKLGDDNTNYMEVSTTGEIKYIGDAGVPFGSLYAHEDTLNVDISAAGQGTYVKITGLTTGLLHHVSVNSDAFNVDTVGVYKVDWQISGDSQGNNKDYEVDIFVDGDEEADGSARSEFGGAGSLGSMSGTAIIFVTDTGHDIDLRMKEVGAGAGTDFDIFNMNFNIFMLGGLHDV